MNTQVEQSQAQNEQAEVTLGEKFRQAREALNLSLEDVSKQIALRPSILVQIENNEFIQKNVPATFVKGYVRSYGKFLRLPESLWNDLSFGESEQIDLDKNVRATRSVNQYSLHNRWIGYLTVLVLFVALSMTGLWWWQNYQKSNEERDILVKNYVSNSEDTQTAPKNSVLAEAPVVQPTGIMKQPGQMMPLDSMPGSVANANEIETESKATNIASVQQEQIENLSSKSESTVNGETAIPDSQSSVENPTISPASPIAQGDLVVEILRNTSWLSVKDSNRKVLVQKEYKQGEVLTFSGDEFSLIVGAPGNVRITYKGENYPLKVDGRVAKFKLSQP